MNSGYLWPNWKSPRVVFGNAVYNLFSYIPPLICFKNTTNHNKGKRSISIYHKSIIRYKNFKGGRTTLKGYLVTHNSFKYILTVFLKFNRLIFGVHCPETCKSHSEGTAIS